jgi:hypothetical protein
MSTGVWYTSAIMTRVKGEYQFQYSQNKKSGSRLSGQGRKDKAKGAQAERIRQEGKTGRTRVKDKTGRTKGGRVQVRSGPAQSGPTLSGPAQSSPAQSGSMTIGPLNN